MRIAKYISNSGYCSRREAEKLIIKKRIYINNKLCEAVNTKVLENDQITIDGTIIQLNTNIQLWKLYKPKKIICTNNDPQKRKTIFDILPKEFPRAILIGRLDFMSEGLILLTNNGDFARKLELPKSNFIRVYRVCVSAHIKKIDIEKINLGMRIDNIYYKKIKVSIDKINKNNTWLKFELKEGKNREIRKICKNFKWPIYRLIRIQFGSIILDKEKPGSISEVYPIPKDLL